MTYNEEICQSIIAKMAGGLTFPAACSEIGISPKQARLWEKQYPKFAEARTLGNWKHRAFYEKLLIHSATGTKPDLGKSKNGETRKSSGVNAISVQFALSRIHHEHYGVEKYRSTEQEIDEHIDTIENLEAELENEIRELGFSRKKSVNSRKNKKD